MKALKIVVVLALSFVLFGCNDKSNKLVMVTEAGFAPYEFYENGKITGVDIVIAEEIAKAMDKELVVRDIAFDYIINEVQSGKADFAAAGMSITEERLKQVDFTIEYTVSNQVVVVRKDSTIKDLKNLDGKTISVQLGTVADTYASKNYKKSKIVAQKKYLTAAEDVKSGKSDLMIMDALPAAELVKQNNELIVLDGILFTDKYGMAIKKGNKELLDSINTVLKRLIEEDKIEDYIIEFSK